MEEEISPAQSIAMILEVSNVYKVDVCVVQCSKVI